MNIQFNDWQKRPLIDLRGNDVSNDDFIFTNAVDEYGEDDSIRIDVMYGSIDKYRYEIKIDQREAGAEGYEVTYSEIYFETIEEAKMTALFKCKLLLEFFENF
jgi:hypothetical protein